MSTILTKEERDKFIKQQKATFGTWYNVYYAKHPSFYGSTEKLIKPQEYCKNELLRLDNINGFGIGVLFFNTLDDRLMVLPWSAIVSMIPVDEPEIYNKKNETESEN